MSISTQRLKLVDSMLDQARHFADELLGLHQDVKDGAGLDVGKQTKLEGDLRATLRQINQVMDGGA